MHDGCPAAMAGTLLAVHQEESCRAQPEAAAPVESPTVLPAGLFLFPFSDFRPAGRLAIKAADNISTWRRIDENHGLF
jgi:hypothetical protein